MYNAWTMTLPEKKNNWISDTGDYQFFFLKKICLAMNVEYFDPTFKAFIKYLIRLSNNS